MLLIDVAAILGYFCFKQFFVLTFEEKGRNIDAWSSFFVQPILKSFFFVQALLTKLDEKDILVRN